MELFSMYQLRGNRRAQSVSCVWLETGNALRPLACVWIATEAENGSSHSREAVASGEEHLGLLVA